MTIAKHPTHQNSNMIAEFDLEMSCWNQTTRGTKPLAVIAMKK